MPGLSGYFLTPWVADDEEQYAAALLEICLKNQIHCVIPLMDYELPVLSRYRSIFQEKGITILVSNPDFIGNTLNKKRFFSFCEDCDIPTPPVYLTWSAAPNDRKIVRKKIYSSAGAGFSIHESKAYLIDFQEGSELIQDFIDAPEYGMDILNDLRGNFLHAAFRRKIAMRSGETDKAEVVFSDFLMNLAKYISLQTRHIGNLDIDFLMNASNDLWMLDFNPRFGGGYPFTHLAGFDYLQAIVDQLTGKPVQIPETGRAIIAMKGIQMVVMEKT